MKKNRISNDEDVFQMPDPNQRMLPSEITLHEKVMRDSWILEQTYSKLEMLSNISNLYGEFNNNAS